MCTDYCPTAKLDNSIPFCDGYYIKKTDGKCENVSEDISSTSHTSGAQITSYIQYKNSKAASISVFNENGKVTVEQGSKELSISNLSNFESIFINREKDKYPKYLIKAKGSDTYRFIDEGEKKSTEFDKIFINVEKIGGIQGIGEEEIYTTCEDLFGENILGWLKDNVFMVIWIGVPILLILLTTFDFAKVVFSDDKDGMPNAFKRFTKRAIAAVLIFLTPTIIILIGNLIGVPDSVEDCVKTIRNMSEQVSV